MNRVYPVLAIVLRRHPLAETDKIVHLFTRERGKLSAVAKGARRPQSRIAGATEPPAFLRATLAVGQNLDIITQCEVREIFPALRTDLDRLAYCSYLLELTDTLLEERLPQPDLFDLMLSALYLLNGHAEPVSLLAAYSLKASEEGGFLPSFNECVRCLSAVTAGTVSGYSVLQGGVVCRVCRPSVKDAFRFPGSAQETANRLLELDLPTIAKHDWPATDVLGLMRVLRRHTEFRTERKLKSAEFLESLRLKEPVPPDEVTEKAASTAPDTGNDP